MPNLVNLMIRRPPRSTRKESSAASDVYKRQTEVFEVDSTEEIVAFVVESETVSPTVNVPFESVDSSKTVDVFEYVLIVAVSPAKSVSVSLTVNVPDTFINPRVTKVLPTYLFSAISRSPPAFPPDVFATTINSCLTSVFAVGSIASPRKVEPLIVFAGINGSAPVGVA